MKTLSIVLPTFNEKDNLEKFVELLLDYQKNIPNYKFQIIISDSHSEDGTIEVAKKLTQRYKNVHYIDVERGLGFGLIKGHQYALKNLNPDILTQIDADGQVEIDVLKKLVEAIEGGYNLALGSRFVKGGKNNLSFSRRMFSAGASWICRIIMGPLNIQEFTNSARAFTPELFKKIDLDSLPWREKTFIVQPAFLNEAIKAGAKYKEVPLVFKNRAEGYSKNKTLNYTYDVITYSIDARLHKLGSNIEFFQTTRRAKTLIKFAIVGFIGTMVDFLFYKAFIWIYAFTPPASKGFSTEIAIISNFVLNNAWTFKHRKTNTNIFQKFFIFNLVSGVGLAIAVFIVYILHEVFGDGLIDLGVRKIAYNNFYFFATIPPVMLWNFLVNHFVTWKNKDN